MTVLKQKTTVMWFFVLSNCFEVRFLNHQNILFSLTGKNLQVTPYNYHTDKPVSCPAKPEEPLVEQYYNEGVVIDGAVSDSRAEHFPEGDLFGAKFNYEVRILDASPLP